MNFSSSQIESNGFHLVQLKDETNNTTVQILPAFGALLHTFNIIVNDSPFNIIDNYSNQADVDETLGTSFKSSKLSPFACRIANAQYTYNGQLFEFENKFVDGNAIHGLLYNKSFDVVDLFADDEQATVLLKYNYKSDDAAYPYHYRCEVRYSLLPQNNLQLQTTVINLCEQIIPMQDGWHPYFTLGDKVDDYLVQMHTDALVEFDEKLVPTGKLIDYNAFTDEKIFGNTQLDNCFLLAEDFSGAACTITNPKNGISIQFYPDDHYPFLQVYTPPHRNSIAVENLSGAPDCFNNKMGLVLLPPGHAQTFTVNYKTSIL